MRVIIGAGGAHQPGWISLERNQLDIRDRNSWAQLFPPGSIDAVLSEHVLEHLYPPEAHAAAANVYEFLRPGGRWRIAVPDEWNPDPRYHEHCRPGGAGQRRASNWEAIGVGGNYPDHKVFYNVESLSALLQSASFDLRKSRALEWYDAEGTFHQGDWSSEDGYIKRSAGNIYRFRTMLYADCVGTSLIVDAVK